MTNCIKVYYAAYHIYIVYIYMSKLFFTIIINGNNCLCYNIIVYKINSFINIIILKIII